MTDGLAFLEAKVGKDHPYVAELCAELGMIHMEDENFKKASLGARVEDLPGEARQVRRADPAGAGKRSMPDGWESTPGRTRRVRRGDGGHRGHLQETRPEKGGGGGGAARGDATRQLPVEVRAQELAAVRAGARRKVGETGRDQDGAA